MEKFIEKFSLNLAHLNNKNIRGEGFQKEKKNLINWSSASLLPFSQIVNKTAW